MNDDTNIHLPLKLDVLLRLTVYSELTSHVPLNSGLAGRKTFVIFSVPARARKFLCNLYQMIKSID